MFFKGNRISDVREFLLEQLGKQYGRDEVMSFMFLLLEEYCGLTRTDILAHPGKTVSESELLKLKSAVRDLQKYKPIQYIIGKVQFHGLRIFTDESALIPRPETEEWVDRVVRENAGKGPVSILDIGTGTGCIALALASALPGSRVVAVDDSPAALDLARRNATDNGLKVEFLLLDIFDESPWPQGPFDIITANPPYVRESERSAMSPNVLQWEPPSALFVPDNDALKFYPPILKLAARTLRAQGHAYLEINEAFGAQMLQLANDMGFTHVEIRKDLYGKDRVLWVEG